MAKQKKTKVVEQATVTINTADASAAPGEAGLLTFTGAPALATLLAEVEEQAAAVRTRQQATLKKLAAATGLTRDELAHLLGIACSKETGES